MHDIPLAELVCQLIQERAFALVMYIYTFGLQSALEKRTGSHASCDVVHISVPKYNYLLGKFTTLILATKIVKIFSEAGS